MKLKKIVLDSRITLTIILCIFLFTTLLFNNQSHFWLTIRSYFYFYFLATFTILYVVVFWKKDFIKISWIDVIFFSYTLFVFFNTLSRSLSFWENDIFLTNIILGVLYFVFRHNSFNRELFWNIGKQLVLFAVMASLYGIIDEIIFFYKFKSLIAISGPFSNSGPFAGYLLSVIPITIGLLYKTGLKGNIKNLYVLALVIELLALLFSESRAGVFGLTISVLFWILHFQKRSFYQVYSYFKNNLGKLFALSSIGVSTLYLVLYYKIDSIFGRLLIWKVSWNIFQDSKIFGIGFGRFPIAYLDYQSKYFSVSDNVYEEHLADNTYYAFNEILQIIIESGTVGLFLFFLLVIFLFFNKRNVPDTIQTSIQSSLLAILGFSLFSYPFSVLPIQLNFVFFLAIASSSKPTIFKVYFHHKVRKTLILVFIVLIGFFVVDQIRKFSSVQKWSKIGDYLSQSDREILSSFEQIYPTLKYRGDFLFNYGARLSEMGYHQKAIVVLNEAKKKFNHVDLYIFLGKSYSGLNNSVKAEESYLYASNMIPNRMYSKYLLLIHYKNNNQWCKAFVQANNILGLQVKVPSFFSDKIIFRTREFVKQYDNKKCI